MKRDERIIVRLAKLRGRLRTKLVENGVPASELDWALEELFAGRKAAEFEDELAKIRGEKDGNN